MKQMFIFQKKILRHLNRGILLSKFSLFFFQEYSNLLYARFDFFSLRYNPTDIKYKYGFFLKLYSQKNYCKTMGLIRLNLFLRKLINFITPSKSKKKNYRTIF